jgi:thioredoxin reductase (NADPH)
MSQPLDVLIIGAGPAGLAAAISAKARGLTYAVLEKGALVNSLQHYPVDMVFFTTPELMEIGELPFVSPHDKPTRQESLRYYRRVADRFALDIALGECVTSL